MIFSIDRTGAVIDCAIVSSDLYDPRLERKDAARRLLNFCAKRAELTTITDSIEFFPGRDGRGGYAN